MATQRDIDVFFGAEYEPPRDLALEALSQIQALDAEPVAAEFRERWLGGEVLPAGHGGVWRDKADAKALRALGKAAESLRAVFGWTERQASDYLLCGTPPNLELIKVLVGRREPGEPGNPAASLFTNTIILECRPTATKAEVAEAYEQMRRLFLTRAGVEPGERNRKTSAPRTRDLAVLGYRIWRGDFESWQDAYWAYELEHPEDAGEYRSSSGAVWTKTFRRDVRNAYERVTGLDLVFRPGMADEGGEPGNE